MQIVKYDIIKQEGCDNYGKEKNNIFIVNSGRQHFISRMEYSSCEKSEA